MSVHCDWVARCLYTVTGWPGVCTLTGWPGVCTLTGWPGVCTLTGWPGVCTLTGWPGVCTLTGWPGVCTLTGWPGVCTLTGCNGKFDLWLLSQCGGTYHCLSKSVPETDIARKLGNQETTSIPSLRIC